jgi:hypothetical protein
MAVTSKYTVCPKCKQRHSTLVRHKCFKAKKAAKPTEFEEVEIDPAAHGGPTESLDIHGGPEGESEDGENQSEKHKDGEADGEAKGEASGEGGGEADEGEGEGQGEGEAEGEAEGGEGQSEGEAEGDGEGEGGDDEDEENRPQAQPPEPEAPPVVVVCTVLKFAALCAACAKNGSIEVNLAEDGLFVYGHNGDVTAYDTIPWGEFEKRSTIDGEFYVKAVIDNVDGQLNPADDAAQLKRLIKEAKKAPKKATGNTEAGGAAKATGKKRKA